MIRLLDLFSGIGGFSLGLERAGGFKTVAFCEIDPFCRKVLRKHWPHVPQYEDIRELTGERLAADGIAVDAICGGFPCQDISVAGKGAGIEGERSGLWSEYARIIGEVRPRYVIVENVAALLGRGLGRVLGDLAALGFDAEWHCIPASAVGAPHRRDRLWLVAYARCERGTVGRNARDVVAASGATEENSEQREWVRYASGDGCAVVADTDNQRQLQPQGREQDERRRAANGGQTLSHANGNQQYRRGGSLQMEWGASARETANNGEFGRTQWGTEPDVGRVAHGVSSRVDRLRSLGNAVVPQIPEFIGRAILAAEAA